MRKILFVAVIFALAMITLTPVYAGVTRSDPPWLGTTYRGADEYYGVSVYAYEEGDKAVLSLKVTNDKAVSINVTSVYVSFDWGLNYSSTQVNATRPLTLKTHETRAFFIEFTVPDTTVASNLYTHAYTIVARYSYPNATDPTKTIREYYYFFAEDFVVYSADQADAVNYMRIISTYMPSLSTYWQSARAKILWNKASKEVNTAREYYRQGDFYSAKQHFGNALDYVDQGWLAEEEYQTAQQDLQIQRTQAEIKSLEAMANLFNGLSAMWMLFGIGGLLFGIGYIVKWFAHMRMKKAEA